MLSCIRIIICVWILSGICIDVQAGPWASPSLERLDELRDAEIYQAVVKSMNEWQRKQNLKKSSNREKRQDSQVCYPDLGCFDTSGPFGYIDMPPSKPEEIATKFLMYPSHSRRRSGSSTGEVPYNKLEEAYKWARDGFNASLPTKVLIHGFGSDCTHVWIYEMRSALMAVEEANVICVDWENGAILPNYVKATANTRVVGKQVAMLLKGMVENNGLMLEKTHLVGFSLGAHVAGFAGAELGNLSRITGLDPAGPLFESQDPRARLDQTDAEFVDVIHSNGENLILGGLGSYQPMGHVDFYPNGGRMQKGCSNIFVGAVSDIIWSSAVEGRSLCNHRRAYKFFTDSVSPRCQFPAFPCDSYEDFLEGKCFPCSEERACGNMGYYADKSKGKGQMYLITRDEEPFCAHQYNVKIESFPTKIPIVSYGKIQITLIGDSTLNETFTMTRKDDEEMKLGQSISKIVVPHPVLLEPTKIQIMYTAYSGWLSSGLTQWKIDKVTLSDSFGKTSSVCKKNLLLESGIPVTLPLYPGECNLPKDTFLDEAQDRIQDPLSMFNYSVVKEPTDNFVPTPVVLVGNEALKNKTNEEGISFRDAIRIFNLPWQNEKENKVDNTETESSRAFNTRITKASETDKNKDSDGLTREVVEPILKPHSSKNGRSHDINKEKPEITEPILRPTTSKTNTNFKQEIQKDDIVSKLTKNDKEIVYNFYDLEDEWVPSVKPLPRSEKWKREDESRSATSVGQDKRSAPVSERPDDLNLIAMTVQILPQRLARMFEQAEKYARETILPFVSTYTPKFISDFIAPNANNPTRYLPLSFEQTTATPATRKSQQTPVLQRRNLYVKEETTTKKVTKPSTTVATTTAPAETTTRYTHIQKISRKKEKENVSLVFPLSTNTTEPPTTTASSTTTVSTTTLPSTTAKVDKSDSRSSKDEPLDHAASQIIERVQAIGSAEKEKLIAGSPEEPQSTGIYIDLPVFEENQKEPKYIPVSSFTEKSKSK